MHAGCGCVQVACRLCKGRANVQRMHTNPLHSRAAQRQRNGACGKAAAAAGAALAAVLRGAGQRQPLVSSAP